MFTAQTVRPAAANPSQPLAWPVVGARRSVFGTSLGAEDDVRALQQIGTKLRVVRGKTIFNEGDPAENAYKVVSGAVRLCKHMADGRRQIAQFAFPGDFVSFMEVGEHNFTAEAVTDVVLMCYAQRQIDKLGAQCPRSLPHADVPARLRYAEPSYGAGSPDGQRARRFVPSRAPGPHRL